MKKLSIGGDSTLGNYLALCSLFLGSDSKACQFLRIKIAESPGGFEEEVIADESQMLQLLVALHRGETSIDDNLHPPADPNDPVRPDSG